MRDSDKNNKRDRSYLEDTAGFSAVSGGKRRAGAHVKRSSASKGGEHRAQARQERPAAPREEKRRGSGAKKALIIVLVIVAVLLAGMAGFAVYVSGTDTIYPNVTLDGVDVGGMTVTEAAYELSVSGWEKEEESVTVSLPMEHTLTVTAEEAGAAVTTEEAAQTAYDHCHDGNMFSCLVRYVNCLFSGLSSCTYLYITGRIYL